MADGALEALQAVAASDAEVVTRLRAQLNGFSRALLAVAPDPSFFNAAHVIVASRERLLENAGEVAGAGSVADAAWAEQIHVHLAAIARAAGGFGTLSGHACAAIADKSEDAGFVKDLAASGVGADEMQVSFPTVLRTC